jgi:putative endonuclease
MKKKYYVYIARCSDDTLYTGSTGNIEERMRKHNGQLPGGAKYTRGRRPVTLLYSETCKNKNMALVREHQIKKLTREQKLGLV